MSVLRSDPEIKDKFNVVIQNRFSALKDIQDVDDQWDEVTKAADKSIPRHCTKAKTQLITDDILNLLEERRRINQNRHGYVTVDKYIMSPAFFYHSLLSCLTNNMT